MEAVGLRRILDACRVFGYPLVDKHVDGILNVIETDEQALREQFDQDILQNYNDPQDVFSAIAAKTQGTGAFDYFLSTMQHMLLIHEEGQALAHYFQIIDSTVTDIVLDRKLNGAESKLGTSVQRIISQLNEAERFQHIEEQASEARAKVMQLSLEKKVLEEEVSQGSEGLVGELKEKVATLEEKLKSSRNTIEMLNGRIEEQKRGYEEQIAQLEAQILELFRMLKELGRGVDQIVDQSQALDRKTLLATLEKQLHRSKTISLLEGRRNSARRKGNDHDTSNADGTFVEEAESSSSPRREAAVRDIGAKGSSRQVAAKARESQFMDADEASVQEHIEQRIAAGVDMVSAIEIANQFLLIVTSVSSTRRNCI